MMSIALIRAPSLRRPGGDGAERRATWLELFFDLAFASAIADAGVALSTDYTPLGLLRFSVVFFLIWWAWVGHTFFSTWFDNDDLVHRLLTLAQVFLVAVMSVNTRTDMATREAAGFVAAYAGIRLLLAIQYSRVLAIGESRPFVLRQTVWIAAAAVTWIAAAVASPSTRLSVMGVAVLLELAGPFAARRAGGTVPADPAHLPERFGLFTLIMIGQSVVAITAGMRRQEQWTAPAAASALLGMLLAFSLWWAYFDSLGAAKPKPGRSRRHQQRMRAWAGVHLPLTFGIAVAAVGIEQAITRDGVTPLGGGAPLLAAGIGLVVIALGVLGLVDPDAPEAPWAPVLLRYGGVAGLLVPMAALGGAIAPVWLLGWFVVLMVVLIAVAQRIRARPTGA